MAPHGEMGGGRRESRFFLPHRHAETYSKQISSRSSWHKRLMVPSVAGHERGDLRASLGGQMPIAGARAELVEQAAGAVLAEPRLHALKLPHAHPEGRRSLRVRDAAGQDGLEQTGPGHFLRAHRQSLHGVTLSPNSYPQGPHDVSI